MKKLVFTSLLLGVLSLGMAQVDVYFQVNHKLGNMNYSPTQTATNNLGNNFTLDRVDYYISRVKLTYDGGQDTVLDDHYILVKADEHTFSHLGSFNITNLESVEFGIGVDQARNHSDITTYPTTHPLSFQLPSMHWGWTAGYRFAALEGKAGAGMNQSWELHALGDQNYGYATVSTAGTKDGNDLVIALDADYEMAFKDIQVNANLNYHGESLQAPTLLGNFQNEVFSEGPANIGLDEELTVDFSIAPNPSSGHCRVLLSRVPSAETSVEVRDITGKLLFEKSFDGSQELNIDIAKKGIYLLSLKEDQQVLETRKLIIQQ